jgi:competence protein ComEC
MTRTTSWLRFALWTLLYSGLAHAQSPTSSLWLTHWDVGQADATLIITPNGRRILIDAGAAGGAVARRLRRARIDTLDLVVASHNHADHIGGMAEVFASVVVLNYMDNGVPHTTPTYARTQAAMRRERGLRYLDATDRVVTVDSVALRVIPPPRQDSSQNNNSVGIVVEYGSFRALYTGDSEHEQLAHALRGKQVPKVTLVKAGHHGAANGASVAWIKATSPKVVVISVGARTSYGHPSALLTQRWQAAGARVYRTDRDGTVEVTASRSGEFNVRTSARP